MITCGWGAYSTRQSASPGASSTSSSSSWLPSSGPGRVRSLLRCRRSSPPTACSVTQPTSPALVTSSGGRREPCGAFHPLYDTRRRLCDLRVEVRQGVPLHDLDFCHSRDGRNVVHSFHNEQQHLRQQLEHLGRGQQCVVHIFSLAGYRGQQSLVSRRRNRVWGDRRRPALCLSLPVWRQLCQRLCGGDKKRQEIPADRSLSLPHTRPWILDSHVDADRQYDRVQLGDNGRIRLD